MLTFIQTHYAHYVHMSLNPKQTLSTVWLMSIVPAGDKKSLLDIVTFLR